MIRKSDAFNELKRAVSLLETQTGRRVKAIRSDQGGEWASDAARTWSLQQGILWQKTTAYNSEQNGRVERMNRTLRKDAGAAGAATPADQVLAMPFGQRLSR